MPPRRRSSPTGLADPSALPTRVTEHRVEALAKALRVLSLFTESRPAWRIKDIADAVSIPLLTVYRIVATLTEAQYLEHLPSGEYRPDVGVLKLGTSALRSLDLVQLATPRLQALGASTGETVNLAVLSGDRILYLVRLRNSNRVTANIEVGSTLPAVHTSIGKALLAHLDDAEIRERVTQRSFLRHAGPNALTSFDQLAPELAHARTQGWALQDEELASGLRSLAAPIFDGTGNAVAGANVAVQSRDWSRERVLDELGPLVLATCRQISALLGHRKGDAELPLPSPSS